MMKPLFKLFYAALLLALCSCSALVPVEKNGPFHAHFCPKEDCGKIIEIQILDAKESIHCAFYDIDLRNVISALSSKSKDIDVRIVTDESTYEGQIKGDGYRLDNSWQLMHNKFCVIDKSIVIMGSMNPTVNDNALNSNNIIIFHSKYLSENYEAEFEELWGGNFGKGNKNIHEKMILNGIEIENYFCPEDDCAKNVIDLILEANKSIYFMTFSFTEPDIANALIAKKDLDIKGVIDTAQAAGQYSEFGSLEKAGLAVVKDKIKGKMHHKVFIMDNLTVITGSFNPTQSGNSRNDENIIVVHDSKIAGQFMDEFNSIYNAK